MDLVRKTSAPSPQRFSWIFSHAHRGYVLCLHVLSFILNRIISTRTAPDEPIISQSNQDFKMFWICWKLNPPLVNYFYHSCWMKNGSWQWGSLKVLTSPCLFGRLTMNHAFPFHWCKWSIRFIRAIANYWSHCKTIWYLSVLHAMKSPRQLILYDALLIRWLEWRQSIILKL